MGQFGVNNYLKTVPKVGSVRSGQLNFDKD